MSDYDTDILVWSERQAELLRRRAAGELVNEADLDWPNIAEEIEALGKSDKRELANRTATILFHLIKLQASPASEPRAGWRGTIREQRDGIRRLIKDSPSLRPRMAAVTTDAWPAHAFEHSGNSFGRLWRDADGGCDSPRIQRCRGARAMAARMSMSKPEAASLREWT